MWLDGKRPAPRSRCLFKIIADGGRGNTAFAHGVTDLVKSEYDIAGGVQTGDTRPLVGIDCEAAVLLRLCAERDCELRADLRAERGIKRVEAQSFGRRAENDVFAVEGDHVEWPGYLPNVGRSKRPGTV